MTELDYLRSTPRHRELIFSPAHLTLSPTHSLAPCPLSTQAPCQPRTLFQLPCTSFPPRARRPLALLLLCRAHKSQVLDAYTRRKIRKFFVVPYRTFLRLSSCFSSFPLALLVHLFNTPFFRTSLALVNLASHLIILLSAVAHFTLSASPVRTAHKWLSLSSTVPSTPLIMMSPTFPNIKYIRI